ncbi:MAG: hypothetical protein QM715_16875 [Nibricoccus sp.]
MKRRATFSAGIVLGLLQLFIFRFVRAEATEPAMLNLDHEPILLDSVTVKTIRDRTKIYELAARNFWNSTQEKRTVSYLDVLVVAYEKAEFDLADALLKKKRYRDWMETKGHDFFCNYGAINVQVPIAFKNTIGPAQGLAKSGSREFAQYNFKRKSIIIERELYHTSLMQASGISLCAMPSPTALERIKKIGAAKKDFEFRRQVGFEIQLQDLNRLYALYVKRPIMNPLEALEALCMLGERPKAQTVDAILTRNGFKADPSVIKKILADTKERQKVAMYDGADTPIVEASDSPDPSAATVFGSGPANNGPEAFLGAHRLLTGLTENPVVVIPGLRRLGKNEYEHFLERILLEAPGHI